MIKLTAPKLNKLLKGMGNSETISKNEWNFKSIAGNLYIKFLDNDFVHMKFEDPIKANEIIPLNLKLDENKDARLNPFSGKFNFHWDKKISYDYKIAELSSYLTNLIQ